MIKVHAVQAQFGDSFILEYGSPVKFLLIDGGPSGVYGDSLRHELKRIVTTGILQAVIVTHIDIDHIKGILELFSELKSDVDAGREPFMKVENLWMNTFSETIDNEGNISQGLNEIYTLTSAQGIQMASMGIAFNGIKEGDKITTLCNILGIPMNAPAAHHIFKIGQPAQPVVMDNLSITIVGPSQENLDALKMEWEDWLSKRQEELESLEILSMSDKSIPNLSSIMFYLKAGSKTFLFTGDGRGDHLIAGLKKRSLMPGGKCHVDVFKVAHHGSNHDSDADLFRTITADVYIISANGKYDNPDYDTLTWIVEAAKEQQRRIKLIVTNETDSTRKLLETHDTHEYGYSMTYIPENKFSIQI